VGLLKIFTKKYLYKFPSTTKRISKEFVEKKIFYSSFFDNKNDFSFFENEGIFFCKLVRNLKGNTALN